MAHSSKDAEIASLRAALQASREETKTARDGERTAREATKAAQLSTEQPSEPPEESEDANLPVNKKAKLDETATASANAVGATGNLDKAPAVEWPLPLSYEPAMPPEQRRVAFARAFEASVEALKIHNEVSESNAFKKAMKSTLYRNGSISSYGGMKWGVDAATGRTYYEVSLKDIRTWTLPTSADLRWLETVAHNIVLDSDGVITESFEPEKKRKRRAGGNIETLYQLASEKFAEVEEREWLEAEHEYALGLGEARRMAAEAVQGRVAALKAEEAELLELAHKTMFEARASRRTASEARKDAALLVMRSHVAEPEGTFTHSCGSCGRLYRAFTDCAVEGCPGELGCHGQEPGYNPSRDCRQDVWHDGRGRPCDPPHPTQCHVCGLKRCGEHHLGHLEQCLRTAEGKCGYSHIEHAAGCPTRRGSDGLVVLTGEVRNQEKGCGEEAHQFLKSRSKGQPRKVFTRCFDCKTRVCLSCKRTCSTCLHSFCVPCYEKRDEDEDELIHKPGGYCLEELYDYGPHSYHPSEESSEESA